MQFTLSAKVELAYYIIVTIRSSLGFIGLILVLGKYPEIHKIEVHLFSTNRRM